MTVVDAALIARLAAQLCHWQVLAGIHRGGRQGGLKALAACIRCGSCGRGGDGVWREFTHEAGKVKYREGSRSAPEVDVPVTALIDYAMSVLTAEEGAELVALERERLAAWTRANPIRRSHRGYAMPWEREAGAAEARALRRARAIQAAVFARTPAKAWEQLDLFALVG